MFDEIDILLMLVGKRVTTHQNDEDFELKCCWRRISNSWKEQDTIKKVLVYRKKHKNMSVLQDEIEDFQKINSIINEIESCDFVEIKKVEYEKRKELKSEIYKELFTNLTDLNNAFLNKYKQQDDNIDPGSKNEIWGNIIEKLYLQNKIDNLSGCFKLTNEKIKVPVTAERNQRTIDKRFLMKDAEKIMILAHAGYSYLNSYADRMYSSVAQCLDKNGEVQIILTNPYSYSGLLISIADEAEKSAVADVKEKIKQFEENPKSITNFINNTHWVKSKWNPAIEGYLELRKRYGDNIKLRLLGFDMYATTMQTEKGAFFEPYLIVNHEEHGMSTFEMKVPKESRLYNNIKENFEVLWQFSVDYNKFLEMKDKFVRKLEEDGKMLFI